MSWAEKIYPTSDAKPLCDQTSGQRPKWIKLTTREGEEVEFVITDRVADPEGEPDATVWPSPGYVTIGLTPKEDGWPRFGQDAPGLPENLVVQAGQKLIYEQTPPESPRFRKSQSMF